MAKKMKISEVLWKDFSVKGERKGEEEWDKQKEVGGGRWIFYLHIWMQR